MTSYFPLFCNFNSLSISLAMLGCLRICLIRFNRRAKTFLHQLGAMEMAGGGCKRRKPRKLSSGLDVSNSDFAAMEVSNQFKQIFELIDENGDGKISPLELSEVLLCLGYKKSIATKEAEGIVREMDCNGDGFLDMDEFMNAMEGNGCGNDQEDHLRDAFHIFDSDRNGKISAQELQRVLVKLGCNKCSLQECRKMIEGVDKNGDGFVDFEEFQLMMTRGAS